MAWTGQVSVDSTIGVNSWVSAETHERVIRLLSGTLLAVTTNSGVLQFHYSDDNGATWNACSTTDSWTTWATEAPSITETVDGKIHVGIRTNTNAGYYMRFTFSGTDVTRDFTPWSLGLASVTYSIMLVVHEDHNNSNQYRIMFGIHYSSAWYAREYTSLKSTGALTLKATPSSDSITTRTSCRVASPWSGDPSVQAGSPPSYFSATLNTSYQTVTKKHTYASGTDNFTGGGTGYIWGGANDFRGAASELVWDTNNSVFIMAGRTNSSTLTKVYYGDGTATGTQLGSNLNTAANTDSLNLASDGSTLYLFAVPASAANAVLKYATYDLTGGLAGSWSSWSDWDASTDRTQAVTSQIPKYTYNESGSNQIDLLYTPGAATSNAVGVKLFGDWGAVSPSVGWGWIPIGG